ncbi:MAG: hypothetical protein ABJC26_09875, partial [Gemmatimonadaceae bacterium]
TLAIALLLDENVGTVFAIELPLQSKAVATTVDDELTGTVISRGAMFTEHASGVFLSPLHAASTLKATITAETAALGR